MHIPCLILIYHIHALPFDVCLFDDWYMHCHLMFAYLMFDTCIALTCLSLPALPTVPFFLNCLGECCECVNLHKILLGKLNPVNTPKGSLNLLQVIHITSVALLGFVVCSLWFALCGLLVWQVGKSVLYHSIYAQSFCAIPTLILYYTLNPCQQSHPIPYHPQLALLTLYNAACLCLLMLSVVS